MTINQRKSHREVLEITTMESLNSGVTAWVVLTHDLPTAHADFMWTVWRSQPHSLGTEYGGEQV